MDTVFPTEVSQPSFRITALKNVSYYNMPGDFGFDGEIHDHWELSYVDKGQVAMQHGENIFLVKAGEMLLCRPNVFHNCNVSLGKPACVVDLEFTLDAPLPEHVESGIIVLSAEERQCMAAIIREAAQTYACFENFPGRNSLERIEIVPFGSQQIICNRLEELLIYACRGNRSIRIDRRLISTELQPNLAEQLQTYLQEHYPEKLTLEKIAQDHCISVTKLKRIFRDEIGASVVTYLTRLRIKEAKHLVRQEKLNFSQIAEAVGFESIHYFSTVFKKQTGMTLSEYARKQK